MNPHPVHTLGLTLWIEPQPTDSTPEPDLWTRIVDASGAHTPLPIEFVMAARDRDTTLEVTLRRHLLPQTAVALLRQLADAIEQHGDELLHLSENSLGQITTAGELVFVPV